MIEKMTGTNEDGDIEESEKGREILSDFNGWENIVQNLIEPIKRTQPAEVYVCTDRAEGQVPSEVSRVVELPEASNQEERGAMCMSQLWGAMCKVQERGAMCGRRYKWLIKLRPDFVFLREFPPLTSLSQDYVHTRFRTVQGISGLTSDHVSWDYCDPDCKARPVDAIGYVNDDMVRVVPGAMMHLAFLHNDPSWESVTPTNFNAKIAENWIDTHEGRSPAAHWPEENLTRFWADRKILTMPLACPGYPRDSRYPHRNFWQKCAAEPVQKLDCHAMASIQTAHDAIMRKDA